MVMMQVMMPEIRRLPDPKLQTVIKITRKLNPSKKIIIDKHLFKLKKCVLIQA